MIVIGSAPGREHWVKDCSASITIPHMVLSMEGYELGKIKWVLENTVIDRFIFIQDTMVIRNLGLLVQAFEIEGSVCLRCHTDFCLCSYAGLYERKTLSKINIPVPKCKGDSIHYESRWTKEYISACEKFSHHTKLNPRLFSSVMRYGRENVLEVNEIYEKYQADWGQNFHPTSF